MILRKINENLLLFLIKTVFLIATFLLTWWMHIQNNDITPATSQIYIQHPIPKKLFPRNADTFP